MRNGCFRQIGAKGFVSVQMRFSANEKTAGNARPTLIYNHDDSFGE
jgi:hypothetical protein